jgi:hypothetical protein
MICPKCRAEFRSGFVWCNDCGIKLLDRLPESSSGNILEFDDSKYVRVSSVQSQFEQGQICSFLEAYNIPTLIRNHGLRSTYGITVGGDSAADILVPREFAADARHLLARAAQGDLRIDGL